MFTIHVFKTRFFLFYIDKREREFINIIKKYLTIINNTHYNERIFKFKNLYIFNKELRHKNLLVICNY